MVLIRADAPPPLRVSHRKRRPSRRCRRGHREGRVRPPFTTDVLAEGVNLQQACQMINYDLPWNPMRIVQRHGRIDRIGSKHDYVHLGLFFPAERLDELLELEERL